MSLWKLADEARNDRASAAMCGELDELLERLYPIDRSLTGSGVRETLAELQDGGVPLEIVEVPTGTPVLDWEVPNEWQVREAWVKDPAGNVVIDFADHNLHLLGYSAPFRGTVTLEELDTHLYSDPARPADIPYRTSYYVERWGFCLPHARRESLAPGSYEVHIDTSLGPGALTYGEILIPGQSEQEILVSSHVCHPSLANDNVSGVTVAAELARRLGARGSSELRYSYRFLWAPGTIGAITWLARNRDHVDRIAHGLVAANLGDPGGFHYKRSRRGDAPVDRAVAIAARDLDVALETEDFVPFGYDERQFCSPGFDLPVGSLTRTPWGRYAEYHTSADDLSLVSSERLLEAVQLYLTVFAVLEADRSYRNLEPYGEPQLGRRGLYRTLGGEGAKERELAILWMLNQSDGVRSVVDVAERSGISVAVLDDAAGALLEAGLLE